jgi:8-oxo-dGTP pyrophosphatase MutT (NUDIX family)
VFENKIHKAFLYHPDEKEILSTLKSKIPVEKAAGGLVYNPKGEILFIYRNGKWDLPKGGIEKNEGKKEAAIREVEEETGVKNLKIIDRIDKTYHIFKRNGKFRLKITYWYKMETSFTENLIPQEEEGIEKAVWVQPNQVVELLENSYENIKLLF